MQCAVTLPVRFGREGWASGEICIYISIRVQDIEIHITLDHRILNAPLWTRLSVCCCCLWQIQVLLWV